MAICSGDSRHHPDQCRAGGGIVLFPEQAALHPKRNANTTGRSSQDTERCTEHPVLVALLVQIQHVESVSRYAQWTFRIGCGVSAFDDLNQQRVRLDFTNFAGDCSSVVQSDGHVPAN